MAMDSTPAKVGRYEIEGLIGEGPCASSPRTVSRPAFMSYGYFDRSITVRAAPTLPMHKYASEFQSVSRTHTGAVRPHNEDSLLERSDIGLWAVSDGMGGHAAGDVASALVVETMRHLARTEGGASFAGLVRRALAEANAELYRRGSARSPDATMGATVTALGVEADRFFCLWVGDSRLYRFRKGTLRRLTRDHRYIQDLLDSGVLTEAAAKLHPQRNVITRAVGIDAELELDSCEGAVAPGDLFLLATDGVTEVCADDDLARILSGQDLADMAGTIVEKCLKGGAPDNLSLVLIRRTNV
jgi:serine/threonine protein phosphatase PrpC